ncbi:MAG: type II toxin-antitoxin system HicA family toxin [bacterium]
MSRISPMKRKALIRYLQYLGFEGPYSSGKHQLMLKGDVTLRLPDPRQRDVGKELLARILRHAKIRWKMLYTESARMERFQKVLEKKFSPKGILLESGRDGSVWGHIISKSFDGQDSEKRLQRIWKLCDKYLDKEDRSRLGLIMPLTPLEKRMIIDDEDDD